MLLLYRDIHIYIYIYIYIICESLCRRISPYTLERTDKMAAAAAAVRSKMAAVNFDTITPRCRCTAVVV
jgi:hypothetical protein